MNFGSGEDNPAGGEAENIGSTGGRPMAQYQAVFLSITIIAIATIATIIAIVIITIIFIAMTIIATIIVIIIIIIREDKHEVLEQLNIPRNLVKEIRLYLN